MTDFVFRVFVLASLIYLFACITVICALLVVLAIESVRSPVKRGRPC